MGSDVKIARALISVTDKTGVVDFARTLVDDFGVEIISTGGTARAIEDAGVPVTPIEEFTGYPEMMDGRVKTLHPKVHGALLARRDSEQHMQEAAQHGIKLIDLVVVNLYEFEKTVANPEVTFADAIEHIDIGGPSMLRSAAKNAASVTVISDPADYDAVLAEMRETGGCTTLSTRRRLQVKVYQTTAAYDTAISRWLAAQASDVADTSAKLEISLEKVDDLRYGENPQQKATVYRFAEGCDALDAAARLLTRLYALAEGKPCLLRFGKMESGSARNAVSDHTHLEGSLRCLDDGLYAALWEQAQAIGRAVGEETGCTVTMTCSSGYPPVTNDAALLAEVRERFPIAEAETTCITEDFSEYQRHAPGVFFFLGTGGIELHAPTFTFPEEILDKGEALLCGLV